MQIAHTFPNVETCLLIFLTIPITICSSERSFSFLKRIKNRLRSSMSQEKLDALGILLIESDVTASIDFDEIIDVFSKYRPEKRNFQSFIINNCIL
jgi:DNA (cytosine-5)-methyltransferase 1